MHRFLTPLPAVYDLGQLGALTATFWPGLLGCNIVDDDGTPSLAVYLDDGVPSGLDGWAAAVDAHVPVPVAESAPPDPLVVLASVGEALAAITPSSTTTTIRAALLAARTAIDTAIEG